LHSALACGIFEVMPASMEFLRGVLGLIAIGCAFMIGRSVMSVRKGWVKKSRLYAWTIRMTACLAAMSIRHPIVLTDIIVWVLAVVAAAFGYWMTGRAKPQEDLTHTIFPDE
jgi:hypothetical protein